VSLDLLKFGKNSTDL